LANLANLAIGLSFGSIGGMSSLWRGIVSNGVDTINDTTLFREVRKPRVYFFGIQDRFFIDVKASIRESATMILTMQAI
jgi:hypothetical protein